jgi:hypothetical protein
MTLRNLREMDKEDVLKMIGLQSKRSAADWILPMIAVFGVGVLVGAGVGLLLAPKPGRELRDDLRNRLQGAAEGIGENFSTPAGAPSDRPSAY